MFKHQFVWRSLSLEPQAQEQHQQPFISIWWETEPRLAPVQRPTFKNAAPGQNGCMQFKQSKTLVINN